MTKRRTLIFSLRQLKTDICRCHDYEFEDVVAEVEPADFYLPELRYDHRVLSSIAQYLSYHTLKFPWNPCYAFPEITRTYDLFFANMTFLYDLEILRRMPAWRKKVGYAICYIDECFIESLNQYSRYLPILRDFDCVVLNCSGTEQSLVDRIGVKTISVPSGIDMMRFFPGIDGPKRLIDISNIGRKDPLQHQQFLKLQERDKWFYYYDTISAFAVKKYREHRENLSSSLSKTTFSVVNPAKFDMQTETQGQEEMGFRYYEGAAAGCVLIGRIPRTPNYSVQFPWKEAVIELPGAVEDIPDFMLDLIRQTERLKQISFDNVNGSLGMHDFAYRWETILSEAGYESGPALNQRKEKLNELRELWKRASH